MKTTFLFLLLGIFTVAALLCGCKPDPKIAKLEAKVADLHAQIELLKTDSAFHDMQISNCIKLAVEVEYNCTNSIANAQFIINPATGLPISLSDTVLQLDTLNEKVSNLITYINSTRPGAKYVVAQPALAASGRIPADVMAQIRADAAAKFPNDYDEQVYIINEQVEAWRKLNP